MGKSSAKILAVGSRGQITIPLYIRKKWQSRAVVLELIDDKVTLSPIHDVGGSLAKFKKDSPSSYDEIRELSWQDQSNFSKYK